MMTVCVVVPVYKVEPYLHRCIDSILHQTYADFELILVDDGSPDCCGMICDTYADSDDRILVIHQPNGGLSAARNSGIDWAFSDNGSEWITFIDSDDWVSVRYLQRLLEIAIANNAHCSICACIATEGEVGVNSGEEALITLSPDEAYGYSFPGNGYVSVICAWGKLYRKELFKQIRYPVGRINEDRFTTYKLLFQCTSVAITTKILYYYYQSTTSITRSKWTPKRFDDIVGLEEQLTFLNENGFHNAYLCTLESYITAVNWQINETKKQSNLAYYRRILRANLREFLSAHKKELGISIFSHPGRYYNAYPVTSYVICKVQIGRRMCRDSEFRYEYLAKVTKRVFGDSN